MNNRKIHVLQVNEVDPHLLTFGKEKDSRSCTVFYQIGDSDYEKLRIQTPKLRICFQPVVRRDKNDNIFLKNVSHSLEELGSDKNKKNIELFQKKLLKLEKIVQRIIPDTVKQNKEFATSFWQKGEYAPTIKSTIRYFKGEASIKVYDKDRNIVSENEIKQNATVSCIFLLDHIWMTDNKYGINWIIEQAVVYDNVKIFD